MTEVPLEALLHLATAQPLLDPGAATRAVAAHPVVERAAQHIGHVEKRYDQDGDPSRLKEAQWIFEKLLNDPAWADEWAYGRALLLAKVSEMTLESFQYTGEEGELRRAGELAQQAVDAARRCVSLMGSEDDARAAFRTLVQRHATLPVPEPPDELVAAMRDERRVLASILPTALLALGSQLTVAFDHGAEHAVIDEAVSVLTDAESSPAAAADGTADRSTSCVRLTAALLLRFKHYGDTADASAMVDVARRAVAHDRSAAALDALGCCLIARAELPGHQQDAAEAVQVLEEAVRRAPAWPWVRGNLAVALAGRYRLHGMVRDAERSLALTRSAMADIPASAPDLARLQQNAMGMQEVLREPRPAGTPNGPAEPESGADSRVDAARRLLAITPAGARSRPTRLAGLAHSLCEQAEQTLDLKVLAEAVATAQQGVTTVPAQSADRAHAHGALGRALTLRYCLLGRADDLAEAETAAREAVATAPFAERAEWLLGLASVLTLRAARPDSAPEETTDAASRTFRDAAEAAELQPSLRLRVCRTWGLWAAERAAWPESAQALTQALDAADRLYRIQTARTHRETSLGQAPALHADAALSLLATGDTEGALRALERGRARLLADALARDRSTLDRLREAGHPDLADAFHASQERLAALEAMPATPGHAATDPDILTQHRTAQDAQHDIVRQIRQVPGFTQFLAAPDVEDVRAAARNRPLLYLAAGTHGALAIAVDQAGQITARPLAGVDTDQVSVHAAEFASAQYARSMDPDRWRRVLDRVTRWLGEALFVPVLDLLPRDGVLAIVPYGLLALLPLHAARLPDAAPPHPQGAPRPHFVVDVCALTVAPSARVLTACSALAARVEPDTLLTVDVGERKDMPPLPHATQEARDVLALWGRGQRLSGEAATAARVRAALPQHPVLHFACHGRSDVFDPLSATLYLTGTDTLTVRDLLDTRGLQARLAVLSACQTAVIGAQLPQEAIGLPTAMIQAGTAGIVGTLWEIQDVAGSLLVRRFFDLWRTGEEPARALRTAQRWLRDTTNGEKHDVYPGLQALQPPSDTNLETGWRSVRSHAAPDYWAAFTYTGW